jgi:hypothetical protein
MGPAELREERPDHAGAGGYHPRLTSGLKARESRWYVAITRPEIECVHHVHACPSDLTGGCPVTIRVILPFRRSGASSGN